MSALLKSRAVLNRVTRLTALTGFSGLVAIGLITMADAVLRHLSLPRIPGFGDISEVFFAIVIASCFPAGLLHDQNVTIRFLGNAAGAKVTGWLNFFGALVTFVIFGLLAYQFILMTMDYQITGRVTPTILMPIAPWWWITTVIFVLCLPVQAWVTVARLYEVMSGQELVKEISFATTDRIIEERLSEPDEGGQGGGA